MANDAVPINNIQSSADIEITTHGSDWLWAVFSVMAFTGLAIFAHSTRLPKDQRVFHYLSVAILFTASVAYFSLASDLGATPITVEYLNGFNPSASGGTYPTRQIWYARYIDWVVTTPLLLLEILLVSGLPLSSIFLTLFLDLVMIITGLLGALVVSDYKTFQCWCLGQRIKKAYVISTSILTFLWFLYPICWGLADGGNQISPDGEMVFYGILDLLAKPVFAVVHLFFMSKCDMQNLQLSCGKSTTEKPKQAGSATANGDEDHEISVVE